MPYILFLFLKTMYSFIECFQHRMYILYFHILHILGLSLSIGRIFSKPPRFSFHFGSGHVTPVKLYKMLIWIWNLGFGIWTFILSRNFTILITAEHFSNLFHELQKIVSYFSYYILPAKRLITSIKCVQTIFS